jgi:hypothetical protein|tara:strand:- start:265 stop:519 length:255 start_codon:yes stop_codon:yes gene_type:complete
MTDLLRELEETSVFLKEYKDMRIALDICTEYMDDQRNIVNNALARIKAKEVLLNLELKNFEEDMVKIEKEQIPESLLKKETNHE